MNHLGVYLLTVLKNIIYGSGTFLLSRLLDTIDTMDVLSLRFMISSVFFSLLIITKRIKVNFKEKKLGFLFLTALFEPVLEFLFEACGVAATATVTAGLIVAASPIVNAFVQFAILKEKTNFRQVVSLCCGVGGLLYIVLKTSVGGEDKPYGVVFLLLAVLCGAMYCSFSRKTAKDENFSATEIACFSSFSGMIAFNGINIVRHMANGNIGDYFLPLFSIENVAVFLFLGVASSVFAAMISGYVLTKLPPVRVSIFGGISTLVTVALGVVFNHEKLCLFHVVGMLLMFSGIVGVNYFSCNGERR